VTAIAPPLPESAPPQSRPPIWPTVLGVLSIVSGVNALVHGAGGLEISALQEAFDNWTGSTLQQVGVGLIVLRRLLALACTVLAIVGGALLLRRRPAGWTLLLIFAIARLLHVALAPPALWATFRLAYFYADVGSYGIFDGIVQIVLRSPYSIVLLVWLCRSPIRRQVAAWRDLLQRQALRPHAGSAWPTTIGILLLVFEGTAALEIALNTLLRPVLMAIVRGETRSLDLTQEWGLLLLLLLRATALVALGAVAGVGLLGRRRWSRILTPIWAIASILFAIGLPVAIAMTYAREPNFRYVLGRAVSAIPNLVLPVFVLIWMLLPKTRAQIATWPRVQGNTK